MAVDDIDRAAELLRAEFGLGTGPPWDPALDDRLDALVDRAELVLVEDH
jgi:hypothetical protein